MAVCVHAFLHSWFVSLRCIQYTYCGEPHEKWHDDEGTVDRIHSPWTNVYSLSMTVWLYCSFVCECAWVRQWERERMCVSVHEWDSRRDSVLGGECMRQGMCAYVHMCISVHELEWQNVHIRTYEGVCERIWASTWECDSLHTKVCVNATVSCD